MIAAAKTDLDVDDIDRAISALRERCEPMMKRGTLTYCRKGSMGYIWAREDQATIEKLQALKRLMT